MITGYTTGNGGEEDKVTFPALTTSAPTPGVIVMVMIYRH